MRRNTALLLALSGLLALTALACDGLQGGGTDDTDEPVVVDGCTLEPQAQCPNLKLGGRSLYEVDLTDADLTAADFSDTSIGSSTFTRAKLAGANFAGADISLSRFTDADLTGADLSGTSLVQVRLAGAKLANLKAEDADWSAAPTSSISGSTSGSPVLFCTISMVDVVQCN